MNLFNIPLSQGFIYMLVRFLICTLVNWFIVDRLYFRKSKRREYYFTFILIGLAIFFLVFFMIFVLEDLKGKTGIGIGIGLFGIFSIMRYRTDTMPVREMTYLFLLICLSVVNALAAMMPITELIATNLIFIVAVWLCEKILKIQPCKFIQYDRIELIKPEKRKELIADIEKRLGLKVKGIDIGGVDLLRDTALLKVYYESEDVKSTNSVDEQYKMRKEDFTETPE